MNPTSKITQLAKVEVAGSAPFTEVDLNRPPFRDALRPDSPVDVAGLNLLLVHLGEILATRRVSDPPVVTLRATLRAGSQWLEPVGLCG